MRKIGFPVSIFNQDSANIDNSNICKIDLTSKNEQFHTGKARRTTTADLRIKNQKKRVGQNKTATAWHSNGFGAQHVVGLQKRQSNSVSRTHRKIQQQNVAVQKCQANLIYLKSKSNAILDNETLLSNQNRKKSPKIKDSQHTLNKNSSNENSNSRFSKNKTQKSISFLKKKISLGQMMMFNINQDGNKGFSASYQDHGCNQRNNINQFSSNISSNDFNIQQGEFNCKIFKQPSTANNLSNKDQKNELQKQNEFLKQKVNQEQNRKLLKVNHQSSLSFSQAIFQTKSNKIQGNLGIQQLSASAEMRRQMNENKEFPSSYNSINPNQNTYMNNMQHQFIFSSNNLNNDKFLLQNEGIFSINKSQQFENLKALTSKTKNKNIFKNQNLILSDTVESKQNKNMQIKSQKKNSIQLTQTNEFSPNRNVININQKTWRDSSQLKKQKPNNKNQTKPKEGGLSQSLYIMADQQDSKILNSAGKQGNQKIGTQKTKNVQQILQNNQNSQNTYKLHYQNKNMQNGNEFQNEAINYFKTLQIEQERQILEQQNYLQQLHLQKQESRKVPPNISTSHRSSQSIHKFSKKSSKNTKKKNGSQADHKNEIKKKKSGKTLYIQQEMHNNLSNQLISNIISPSESLFLQQQEQNLLEMQENRNSNNMPLIQINDNQTSYLDETDQKQAYPFQKQKFQKQMKNFLGNNTYNQFKNHEIASLRYSQDLQQ